MSAASVPRPKHDICKVPLSYFTVLLQEFAKPSDRAYFGLILNLTIGLAAIGKARTWTPITTERLAEVGRVDPDYVTTEFLVACDLIRARYIDPSHPKKGMEYSISPNLVKETKGERIQGRCSECKVIGQFSTEFIPMPRSFFGIVASGLENDEFLALAVISRYSHERAWSAEAGLIPQWKELELYEFERLSGMDRRSIQNGIAKIERKGLIEVKREKGKPNQYRTIPENWADLHKRRLRLVEQPPLKRDSENTTKQISTPSPKTPINPPNPPQSSRYGYCSACCHIVAVEEVSEEELRAAEPKQAQEGPRRAPPGRETGGKSDRNAAMWDKLKQWHGQEKKVIKA